MAEIIQARVWQKVDTEANWLANPLPLGSGEQAFVSDKNNFKVNTFTTKKTFAELEYYYKGDIIGGVLPTDDLASKPDGVYRATISGDYSGVVVKEGYYTLLRKTAGVWKLESEVKMPMQDLTQLENQVLTYTYDGENADLLKKYIKNIYINSSFLIKKIRYIGINDNETRKILVMLLSEDDKIATFYIRPDDLRELKNNIIELVDSENDEEFKNSTRVWVEFNDIDFPSISEVSFLIHNNTDKLKLINDYYNSIGLHKSFKFNKLATSDVTFCELLKLVENIYISKNDNSDIKDDIIIEDVILNQWNERKFLLGLKYKGDKIFFFTEKNISRGSKLVKLDKFQGNPQELQVYVDFRMFKNYPNEQINIGFLSVEMSPTEYMFNNKKIELNNKITVLNPNSNEINISKEQGNNAVQLALDSIKDASLLNRYQINVANGLYEIHKPSDFIGNPGYPAMICPKNYVDITGEDKVNTILSADFDEDTGNTPIDMYQTIYNWANESTISNITFIAKNLRYTLHQDNPKEANGTRYYNNCDFIFKGNKGYNTTLGIGTYTGSKTYVNGGRTESQAGNAFSVHNNINFDKSSLWHFTNHSFEVLENQPIINLINSGSNRNCEVIFNDCEFLGNFIMNYSDGWLYQQNINDHFNHANFSVKGNGNSPFYFKNTAYGITLCIETLSKTKDSKVRFDVNSSAYPIFIQNHINNYFGNLGNPNRKIKDDYVIQDGANGISGFAFGGKSILEGFYNPDVSWLKRESFDSLGLRLGDCSVTNKVLGIIINGVTYNITFNKNYTAFTNTQIIAEINAVIGSVAIVKEYNIGADYYAEMTDIVMIGINNSTTDTIPKGTLVTKIGNRIAPCGENDKLYGLLIDDLGAYELDNQGVVTSKARVIRNCYVSLDNNNISSVLYDTINGSKYKISNGRFVSDISGGYTLENSKYILI